MLRECRCRAAHDTLSTNNLCRHVNSYFDRTVYQPSGVRRASSARLREDSLPDRSINENSCLHNHTLDHNYRLPFSSAREKIEQARSFQSKVSVNYIYIANRVIFNTRMTGSKTGDFLPSRMHVRYHGWWERWRRLSNDRRIMLFLPINGVDGIAFGIY